MHHDPLILQLVVASLVLLGVGLMMRILRQPHVVGYLLAGMLLGPHGIALVTDIATLQRVGDFGVILLLFFVGMKVSPRRLIENWRITILGTLVQIGASVAVMAVIGTALGWPMNRIVLMGFVISLSSTAIVLTYLHERGELQTRVGQDVVGVLLAQDLAIIPMLIIIGLMAGGPVNPKALGLQGAGVVFIGLMLWWLTRAGRVRIPLGARLRADHEMQVFAALVMCLGLAFLMGLFGLSSALGAFMAGMLIGVARETSWVQNRLEPLRVVFVAVFFVSVGSLVDLQYAGDHWGLILSVVGLVLATNWLINAGMFHMLGESWGHSVYAGALLSQIGEFSFLLAAFGLQVGMITGFAYQLTVAVIALSLVLAPAWIALAGFLNPSGRVKRGNPSWIC